LEIAFGTAEAVPFQSDFPALKALANKYPPAVNVPDAPLQITIIRLSLWLTW
jgi:hypothetical protein